MERTWRITAFDGAIMRAFAPDVAFLFVGTPRYVEIVLRLIGVRRIYRVPNHHGVPKLLTNSALTAENDWDISKHGVEDRLRAVRLYGVQAEESPMRLPVQEAWVLTARGWLKSHDYAESRLVLLQVGASSARRRWPIDRFANLARRLVAEFHDLRCVVTGSPEERDYCCRVVELARDARVCTSAGELSLGGLAGIMSLSTLLVTPDTGTMHLGHAVGVNSVCLYSMSPVHRTRALDEAYVHKVVQRRPAKGVVLSPAELENCMSLIPMEDVYEACRQVLNALS